ncbi:MAG: hypothetical protein WCT50_04955 [Patescibacteria group bacterium]
MKKNVILLSELSFIACLAHANIKMFFLGKYLVRVSFVPESALDEAAVLAAKKHDLVIVIGYKKFFSKETLAACNGKLLLLSHQQDEQGGKFIIHLFEQTFKPKAINLINNIRNIANAEIGQSLYLDIGDIKKAKIKSKVDEFLALRHRYLQALTVVESFYGIEENIRFHRNFLLELIGEEENEYWIDEMIQIHTLPKEETPTVMFPLKFMRN